MILKILLVFIGFFQFIRSQDELLNTSEFHNTLIHHALQRMGEKLDTPDAIVLYPDYSCNLNQKGKPVKRLNKKRETYFNICYTTPCNTQDIDPFIVKQEDFTFHFPMPSCLKKIGYIHLIEQLSPPSYEERVFLGCIEIDLEHRRGGRGTKAMDALFDLLTTLNNKKPGFYTQLGLHCADIIKGKNRELMPERLKWYLNLGFVIHPRTQEIMNFLSLPYFINNLTESQLKTYICEYNLYEDESSPELSPKHLKEVLSYLKKMNPVNNLEPDLLLQMAETNGTVCAEQIADRVYYWDAIDDCVYNEGINNHLYFLTCSLAEREANQKARLLLKKKRAESPAFDASLLETVNCNGWTIFKLQEQFNTDLISAISMFHPIEPQLSVNGKRKSKNQGEERNVKKIKHFNTDLCEA